jgi:hypothetical protein
MPHADTALLKAPTGTVGFWLAVPMAALQAYNVVRVVLDAEGFAAYMGAPLAAANDASWVLIYGLRTAFIALLVTVLLVRRDLDALKWTALAGLVMPLGDAWIAHQAGAETTTVARHLAIAAYLLLTTLALFVASRARAK